jgi:cytoskeletal protein RodZ
MSVVLKSQLMASLGQDLKRERELRGISLEEISNLTKISLKQLEAVEQDHLDDLPGEFFTKAILKAYANSIGLEEDTVMNKYYEESLLQEPSPESKLHKEKAKPAMKKKIIGIAILVVISTVILIFVYLTSWKKRTPLLQEEIKPWTLIQKEAPISLPGINPSEASVIEEEKLALEISFTEETWLQVYADGELEVEATKMPGERISVEASEELLIHLGNAGGVAYRLNDREGKPLGASGVTVRNIRITIENFKDFILQEPEEIEIPDKVS